MLKLTTQCTYAPSTIYTSWYLHNVYDRSISTDLANSALLWSVLCRHFKNGKSCPLSGGERRAMDAMAFLELDVRQKLSATSFQLNQELSCITLRLYDFGNSRKASAILLLSPPQNPTVPRFTDFLARQGPGQQRCWDLGVTLPSVSCLGKKILIV